MGARVAPSYSIIFMKYMEIQLLDTSPKKPKICFRFIDDIIMTWGYGRNELENFIHLANTYILLLNFLLPSITKKYHSWTLSYTEV